MSERSRTSAQGVRSKILPESLDQIKIEAAQLPLIVDQTL